MSLALHSVKDARITEILSVSPLRGMGYLTKQVTAGGSSRVLCRATRHSWGCRGLQDLVGTPGQQEQKQPEVEWGYMHYSRRRLWP